MTDKRVKWVALGLAATGIGVLAIVAAVEIHGGALLTLAVVAAIFVLLLPLAAYFVFRPR
jgi:hypothetical protein